MDIISQTARWKKNWNVAYRMSSTSYGVYRVIRMMSSVKWYSRHYWLNQNPYTKNNLTFYRSDLRPGLSEELNNDVIGHVVWWPYWIENKNVKNLFLQNFSTDRCKTSYIWSTRHGEHIVWIPLIFIYLFFHIHLHRHNLPLMCKKVVVKYPNNQR